MFYADITVESINWTQLGKLGLIVLCQLLVPVSFNLQIRVQNLFWPYPKHLIYADIIVEFINWTQLGKLGLPALLQLFVPISCNLQIHEQNIFWPYPTRLILSTKGRLIKVVIKTRIGLSTTVFYNKVLANCTFFPHLPAMLRMLLVS